MGSMGEVWYLLHKTIDRVTQVGADRYKEIIDLENNYVLKREISRTYLEDENKIEKLKDQNVIKANEKVFFLLRHLIFNVPS